MVCFQDRVSQCHPVSKSTQEEQTSNRDELVFKRAFDLTLSVPLVGKASLHDEYYISSLAPLLMLQADRLVISSQFLLGSALAIFHSFK